jgi:histidyl-tRNA synthetase
MPTLVQAPDVYVVIGGPVERRAAFGDIHALRSAGYRVEYPMREMAFGKQFKAAAESGARLALIYGTDELTKGVVKVRDLGERSEREVPVAHVLGEVRGFFSGE